jgi:hypothetical protein
VEVSMEENLEYMRWLEQMWDVGKFDSYGRTQCEGERTEVVLGVFEELVELSRRRVEVPDLPFWEAPGKIEG